MALNHRSTLLGLAAISMILSEPRDASAQPSVIESLPANGSIVDRLPDRVVLRFSSGIDTRSTRISLIGPAGSSSLLIERSGGPPMAELSIAVPDGGSGAYAVRWEIVAADGDRLRGKLRFVVRP
jgi:methionine-rich copper-binding protein CopC